MSIYLKYNYKTVPWLSPMHTAENELCIMYTFILKRSRYCFLFPIHKEGN